MTPNSKPAFAETSRLKHLGTEKHGSFHFRWQTDGSHIIPMLDVKIGTGYTG